MVAKPQKICFVGGPSTGKTTLAKHVAEELIKKNYSAELVGEFARDFIANKGLINEPVAQLAIVRGQKEREEMAHSKNPEFIICDAASFLSPVYFHFLKDTVFGETKECKEIEKQLWREISGEIASYDFVFFLPIEFAPEQDGVRLFTGQVNDISNRIQKFLNLHNIKHHELKGTVGERAAKAFKIICLK